MKDRMAPSGKGSDLSHWVVADIHLPPLPRPSPWLGDHPRSVSTPGDGLHPLGDKFLPVRPAVLPGGAPKERVSIPMALEPGPNPLIVVNTASASREDWMFSL